MNLNELENLRLEINKIDDELIELFMRRMKIVRDVAAYKIKNHLEVLDRSREDFIIKKYTSSIGEPHLKKEVTEFIQGMLKISREAQSEIIRKNIVLIGMPGAGKTTLGKELSERLGFMNVDIDTYIEEKTGTTITQLFLTGESNFREIETNIIREVSRNRGTVITTGGGTIKNYINIENLRENGIIVFIDRPLENILEDIEMQTRPLLKDGKHKLYDLYNERYDLYSKYCDFKVKNDKSIEDAVNRILEGYRQL